MRTLLKAVTIKYCFNRSMILSIDIEYSKNVNYTLNMHANPVALLIAVINYNCRFSALLNPASLLLSENLK